MVHWRTLSADRIRTEVSVILTMEKNHMIEFIGFSANMESIAVTRRAAIKQKMSDLFIIHETKLDTIFSTNKKSEENPLERTLHNFKTVK